MKKLTAIALVLFLTLSLFVGCAKESTYQLTQVDNVSISISDVSSTGATVTIKDSNEEAYVYGEWYKIEKEKNGKWYEVEKVISNYGFNDLGYLTDKDGEIEFPID